MRDLNKMAVNIKEMCQRAPIIDGSPMIPGLTCQQTTLSPPPPPSPSLWHPSLPLSPGQHLAQQHVCGGCRGAPHPARLASAAQSRRLRRAGGGVGGASRSLSESPVAV